MTNEMEEIKKLRDELIFFKTIVYSNFDLIRQGLYKYVSNVPVDDNNIEIKNIIVGTELGAHNKIRMLYIIEQIKIQIKLGIPEAMLEKFGEDFAEKDDECYPYYSNQISDVKNALFGSHDYLLRLTEEMETILKQKPEDK